MDVRLPLRLTRLFLLALWTALMMPPVLAGCFIGILYARSRAKIGALSGMILARGACAILGISVGSTGYREINAGFTVCNHVSYIDILVMASVSPSIFVSKLEVKSWPVIGSIAWLAGTIFIDRRSRRASKESLIKVESVIRQGVNVVAFPEGTTTDGNETGDFKRMLFEAPAKANAPVIPVSIKYYPDGEKGRIPWYGEMTLLPHLWNLLGISRINAFLYFSRPIVFVPKIENGSNRRKYLSAKSFESVKSGLYSIDRWLAY